jgi:hypothetical protein
MKEFFAGLFEWWGLWPYSKDLGDHLRGFDITCTDYIGTPWYIYIGIAMILVTGFFYSLQYHIIDSPRFMRRKHWWINALIIVGLNFLIAFILPYNSLQSDDYCNQLHFTAFDCVVFGLSSAAWSLLLYGIISSIPLFRRFSTNCRQTTFWKPS